MKIIFLSHTAMGGSFVVGSHHLAKALTRMGNEVLHVSAPVSLAHVGGAVTNSFTRVRLRRWLAGGAHIEGVREVVPFAALPWQIARLTARSLIAFSRWMLASPIRGIGSLNTRPADFLIVDDPRFVGLTMSLPSSRLIYRATDLYAQMHNDRWMLEAERLICRRADLLIATSEPVAEHLRQLSNRAVHVIANGVDFDHFAGPRVTAASGSRALPGNRPDRAVYVGAFDSRFGIKELRAAATLMPRKYFLLVGPGAEGVAADLGRANVVSLGAVDYSLLPDILSQCAVGLLPMSVNASNAGRSPMKLYEYAAAGLAIAATSTPEIRRRKLPSLFTGIAESGFSRAVEEAFECAENPVVLDEGRDMARLQGWSMKAVELLSLCSGSMPSGQHVVPTLQAAAVTHQTGGIS